MAGKDEQVVTIDGHRLTLTNLSKVLYPETGTTKRDVIAYLTSIQETPAYGGFGLGGLGPVSEGLFAWLVGSGVLGGFAVWIAAHTTRSNKDKVEA
jgi:ubiquinol-cytochrome c reductase cytochrome c subunit